MWLELFDEVYTSDRQGTVIFGICIKMHTDGAVDVVWHPEGQIETIDAKEKEILRTSDRFFHPGEFVLSTDDRLGYVVQVQMFPTVQILGENQVLNRVDSKRLERVQGYRPGDIIMYHNNWVGEILKVKRSVKLRFEGHHKNGNEVLDWDTLVAALDEHELDPFGRSDVFYPGLAMKSCWWKSADLTDPEFQESYVDEVYVDELEVLWLNCIQDDYGTKEKPDRLIGREEISGLDRLKPFDNLAIQLGSIRLMRLNDGDVVLDKHSWSQNPFENHTQSSMTSIPMMTQQGATPVEVIHTITNVTVVWADNRQREILNAVQLRRFGQQGLNVYPSGFVQDETRPLKIGVVLEMNLMTNMAKVAFFGMGMETTIVDGEVSLYNLRPHPVLQYRPGTIVTINEDDMSSPAFGYVLFFDFDKFKVKISTGERAGFVCLYNLKPLALRYPRTESVNGMLDVNLDECDVEMLNESDSDVRGCGWTFRDLKEFHKVFVDSRIMNIYKEVPLEHPFCDTPPITWNSERLKNRMSYEFIRLAHLSPFIKIKAFFGRMYDLYSVMMQGKDIRSPYSKFIFIFDIQIPPEYPAVPPNFKHFSSTSAIFSPFISKDGDLEIPILKRRFWSANFTLDKIFLMMLDIVFVELPALIPDVEEDELETDNLVETVKTLMESLEIPFEARRYNEALFLNLLTHSLKLVENPPSIWVVEIRNHFSSFDQKHYFDEVFCWIEDAEATPDKYFRPPFPLHPISKGGAIAIKQRILKLKAAVANLSTKPQ